VISVVVLTLNEAANLPRCLASVGFSDDVLVLDSGSTDGTQEIARRGGARVLERPFDTFGAQRNHAMEHGALRHPWVLHLDADEAVTPALRDELLAVARSADPQPVYRVPSRLMWRGRWLRHAGMYPAYQVRFGRADALRFVDHGHGQREVQDLDDVGTLAAPLEHDNFSKGVDDWFARHLRYAKAEAHQALAERRAPLLAAQLVDADPTVRRRALKRVAAHLPFRPLLRFLYVYVLRRGFLDGGPGFQYAAMLAVYQYFIDLNVAELAAADAGEP
jgi:glycosyltransferase involved in cell wall biosynthesis